MAPHTRPAEHAAGAFSYSTDTILLFYRFYLLDEHGHIVRAYEAELADDAAAIEEACGIAHPSDISIWQLDRHVGEFDPATRRLRD